MTIAFLIHPLTFVGCTTAQCDRWTKNSDVLLNCLKLGLVWNSTKIFLMVELVIVIIITVQELLVLIKLRFWELLLHDVL